MHKSISKTQISFASSRLIFEDVDCFKSFTSLSLIIIISCHLKLFYTFTSSCHSRQNLFWCTIQFRLSNFLSISDHTQISAFSQFTALHMFSAANVCWSFNTEIDETDSAWKHCRGRMEDGIEKLKMPIWKFQPTKGKNTFFIHSTFGTISIETQSCAELIELVLHKGYCLCPARSFFVHHQAHKIHRLSIIKF